MLHLGPIWYHSEPSDVPYSQKLPRPISWIGLFLQLYDSNTKTFQRRNILDGCSLTKYILHPSAE